MAHAGAWRGRLSLRVKIYLIVGFTLLVAVAVVFMVSQTVFMRGFASVENSEMQEQIKRAKAAVSWDLSELSAAARSYSSRADTLSFLQYGDPNYADSGFPTSFFTGFDANAAAILDSDGTILWGRGFDLENPEITALPGGLDGYHPRRSSRPAVWSRPRDLRDTDALSRPDADRHTPDRR